MNKYKILGYELYFCPTNPTENGIYFAKTPILEQALGILERAKQQNKHLFIMAVCDDGIRRYYY